MKIVLIYGIGDGCTFSCTETVPVEYDSLESAIVNFETVLKEAVAKKEAVRFTREYFDGVFTFAGHKFNMSNFIFDEEIFLPEFLTVDEWFQQHGAQNG